MTIIKNLPAMGLLLLESMSTNASIINGSFESGDFSGWSISPITRLLNHNPLYGAGDTEVASSFAGIPQTAGDYQALITTAPSGNVSPIGVELSQTFYGTQGSNLSFDWNFLTREIPYGPTEDIENYFNDTAAFSLYSDRTSQTILDTVLAEAKGFDGLAVNVNSYDFNRMTGYNNYSYILPYDGFFTMSFSIWDVGDHEINSGLLIDNIKATSVSEPPVIWLYTIGLISLIGFAKRKSNIPYKQR